MKVTEDYIHQKFAEGDLEKLAESETLVWYKQDVEPNNLTSQIKHFGRAYSYGIGAGMDPLGLFALKTIKTGTKTIGSTLESKAVYTNYDESLFTTFVGATWGIATGMAIGILTGGLPFVVTGLIDSVYCAYEQGKKTIEQGNFF